MEDTALLRRLWDFEQALGEAAAERVEDVGDGLTAVLTPSLPLVWDANYLVAESPGLSAGQIAAKADEVLGALGMQHRTADPRNPAWEEALLAGFEELGWESERGVYMVLRGQPDRPAEVEAEEVTFEEVREIYEALVLEPDWSGPEVAEQLVQHSRLVAQTCRDRWFAARHEGELASACRLLQRDGIGQVEDVSTLEPARNRGLARAVVLAAAERSRADGDELTFIVGDADEWPKELYARLGFEEVGVVCSFRRKPDMRDAD